MNPVLQGLAARAPLQQRVALVVAHPDDETIAAGASLHLMPGLVLVHVTDGAPRRLDDARSQGFDTPEAYGAAREAELQAALATAGVAPERVRLGVPDQDAALHLRGIAGDLGAVLARHGIEAVLTHAYEGGHPDHDATALAVHLAARRVGTPVFEFAGYHGGFSAESFGMAGPDPAIHAVGSEGGDSQGSSSEQRPCVDPRVKPGGDVLWTTSPRRDGPGLDCDSGPPSTSSTGLTRGSPSTGDSAGCASAPAFPLARDPRIKSVDDVLWAEASGTVSPQLESPAAGAGMVVQRFLPGPAEVVVQLAPGEAARKQAMLDCFRTQAGILRLFSPSEERFRPAPAYDFRAPPHAGPLNYETWGWEMTGVHWRRLAAAAMEGRLACAG